MSDKTNLCHHCGLMYYDTEKHGCAGLVDVLRERIMVLSHECDVANHKVFTYKHKIMNMRGHIENIRRANAVATNAYEMLLNEVEKVANDPWLA